VDFFWYLLVAILGVSSLAIAGAFRAPWWLRIIAALAITVVAAALIHLSAAPQTLGREPAWYDAAPFREVILFALMLSGMAARVVSLAIEQRRAPEGGVPRTGNALKIDRWEFVYPMLFAVPMFGAILAQVKDDGLTISNAILAFQTGFFWQTILKKQEQA
jgi:hypothetical protein